MASHVSISEERLAELQSATRQDPDLCMLADENHPIRLAGTQERGASKPAAVFSIQRRVVYTERADLQNKKNSHSGDRKDKREYYASSPQEPHGTAGKFAKSTGSRLLARSPHRLGEVSVTVRTVSDIKKRTKPKNHQ